MITALDAAKHFSFMGLKKPKNISKLNSILSRRKNGSVKCKGRKRRKKKSLGKSKFDKGG